MFRALKIIIVISLLSFFMCEPPKETTGTIAGMVFDARSLQPLAGVTISTNPAKYLVYTLILVN